jgi:hypothetical protein
MSTDEQYQQWDAVDSYFSDTLGLADPALDGALKASDAAGLPQIAVSAPQGRLLQLLAQIHGARRILEIGTLGGYSTICLARALPEGGTLVSLEFDPKHAEVARANIATAGLADKVEVRVGPALPDRGRQRGPRRKGRGRHEQRPGDQGHPGGAGVHRRRTPAHRHRDPDRGVQGLRRLRPGGGDRVAPRTGPGGRGVSRRC